MDEVEDLRAVSAGRPVYHFIAPQGWMNDPCAPGYDSSTGLYHMFYQWTPDKHCWSDISWGHAVSKDMLNWEHDSQTKPVFAPDQEYDSKGVFTGCFHPAGPEGQVDQLSVFYTSVCHLPISWDIPYTRGCEGLGMAHSTDGGKTWTKRSSLVLDEEPPNIHVTGFRDPFVGVWPAMDKLRGVESLYGIISGGEHDKGPRSYLYSIDRNDLTKWTYLHPLTEDLPENHAPSRWAGDFGRNWECSNFFTLPAKIGKAYDVFIAGSEGGNEQHHVTQYRKDHPGAPKRVPRYGNWAIGRLAECSDEVRFRLQQTGLLDWGIFYAATSCVSADGRRVLWGWIIEEDLTDAELKRKTWTGCFGVPRELFIQTIDNVVGALRSNLDDIASAEVESTVNASSVSTLGQRPLRELEDLKGQLIYTHSSSSISQSVRCVSFAPLSYRLEAILHVYDTAESVSLLVRQSEDESVYTKISFDCLTETITVVRTASTDRDDINTSPEVGAHTLYRIADGSLEQSELEPLRLTVFVDRDVLEVFANDRFAISTRVYTDRAHTGVSVDCVGDAWVEELKIWEMIGVKGSG